MIDLLYFTNRVCADAQWAAKRQQLDWLRCLTILHNVRRTILRFAKLLGLCRRLCQTCRHRWVPRAVVFADKYSAPHVPRMCSVPSGWRRSLPLPLPPFATQVVAQDVGQSYASSPGPGHQPLAWIWPPLTPRVLGRLQMAPRCPRSLWTGVLWAHWSSVKLLHPTCPQLQLGFRHLTLSIPRCR